MFRIDKGKLAASAAAVFGLEAEAIVTFWRERTRAYRPGRLRRNGYVVTWLPHERLLAHVREQIPRRKRKYRLDFPRLVSPE